MEILYVNTSVNPANCASTGITPNKFMKNLSWFHSPVFLKGLDYRWPDRPDEFRIEGEDSEVRLQEEVSRGSNVKRSSHLTKLQGFKME